MDYSIKIPINDGLENAKEKLLSKLKEKWFGLVTELNLSKIFENKLWEKIGEYHILWVCNPWYSYKLYSIDPMLGWILPCKIVLFTKDTKNYIWLVKPTIQNNFLENKTFKNVIEEVENILIETIKNI